MPTRTEMDRPGSRGDVVGCRTPAGRRRSSSAPASAFRSRRRDWRRRRTRALSECSSIETTNRKTSFHTAAPGLYLSKMNPYSRAKEPRETSQRASLTPKMDGGCGLTLWNKSLISTELVLDCHGLRNCHGGLNGIELKRTKFRSPPSTRGPKVVITTWNHRVASRWAVSELWCVCAATGT